MAKKPARKRATGGQTRAERNIAWIEKHCRIPEGKDVGKPVRLRSWQKEDLTAIYDNPHGTRTAIWSFAKKNAKTTGAAFILLLHLCGPEAVANTQINSTAQSRDQAAILFALAAKIVRMSPSLFAVIQIRDTAKELGCPEIGTVYRALSADATTAHGKSPILNLHDELGQVRGPVSELYNAVENAMGAHDNPMSVIISTQAATDGDLLSILIDDALRGEDPHIVIRLYTADMSLDPFSEEAIKQANPAFNDFLNKNEVLRQAELAKRMPSQESLYRNYTLNQRVEAHSPFISRASWEACNGPVNEDWSDRQVYCGLDLSSTSDLTALVMAAQFDGVWHVKPMFWLPGEGLGEKSRADRVPYDVWASQGFLNVTPGKTIEYEWVARELRAVFDDYDIAAIAFDRWGFKYLKPWLEKAGFSEDQLAKFVEMGQGYQSMSPALRDLESLILEKRIQHGAHPVLTMCMANAVVQADPAGNRKLNKVKSTGRIDGAIALTMAIGSAPLVESAPTPEYQLFFLG